MTSPSQTVIDTGTHPAETIPESLEVRHFPALERRALNLDRVAVAQALSKQSHVLFYSKYGAQVVLDSKIFSPLSRHRFWAVGKKTAAYIEERLNINVSVPKTENFKHLCQAVRASEDPLPLVAFGLLDHERDLSELAADLGVEFEHIPVYDSEAAVNMRKLTESFDEDRPDWLAFTSSRGAAIVIDALTTKTLSKLQKKKKIRLAAIGPSTAETIEEFELNVDLIADSPDREKLLEAIADAGEVSK